MQTNICEGNSISSIVLPILVLYTILLAFRPTKLGAGGISVTIRSGLNSTADIILAFLCVLLANDILLDSIELCRFVGYRLAILVVLLIAGDFSIKPRPRIGDICTNVTFCAQCTNVCIDTLTQ